MNLLKQLFVRASIYYLATILLASLLAVVWVTSPGGHARASAPVRMGRHVPDAVATAPTEISTATNTATPVIGTNTPTPPPGSTATNTPRAGSTRTPTPTNTRGIPTPVPTDYVSPTPCPMNFSDVQPSDWFYDPVHWLVCNGIVSGYSNHTFLPGNNTTRAQLSKMVVLASAWELVNPPTPTFSDVAYGEPFYSFIETAAAHGAISGYVDHTFRPGNNVTRGQLSKIVVLARGWTPVTPDTATFTDVPVGSTFFSFVETAVNHTIISGYSDGTFHPGSSATRAQLAKIIQLAYAP